MRLAASKELKMADVPCVVFPEDTPVEKLKEIAIKDNGAFGEWNYSQLAEEWDDLPLCEWGVPEWNADEENTGSDISGKYADGVSGSLNDRFVVPPFSVLDTRRGYWIGGCGVDAGATNRKLGSDMAQSVTGGGLHGKDLSKADVSVNIYAFLKAQETKQVVSLCCAIGDEYIDGRPYAEIVDIARTYIKEIGGFERFAEWGLI